MIMFINLSIYPAEKSSPPSKSISLLRLIPGIPQLKDKKIVKGSLFLASFLYGIYSAVHHHNKGNQLYDKYMASQDVNEIVMFREQTERRFKKRNYFLIGAGALFFLHLIDLKFSKKRGGVRGEIKNSTLRVSLYYSF